MNKCDIIIPIYNAYDCVIECIESVIKNTTFNGNILYLIFKGFILSPRRMCSDTSHPP